MSILVKNGHVIDCIDKYTPTRGWVFIEGNRVERIVVSEKWMTNLQ